MIGMGDELRLSKIVGRGYSRFWNCRTFYRLVKGSKGSKKSKTAALWYIYHMMKYPDANTLCIRRTFSSLQDSCAADLMWAANQLGVYDLWRMTVNPLKITYLPTGQVILFRGMDDAQKLASINVPKGYLCWVWFEEFFQITNEEEFDKLAMSIRGYIPPETGLFKQITCTFNPWSEHSWIKKRFFDKPSPNVFTDTTTYKDNEFLDQVDIERYEQMYIDSPRRARIICDGDWGIAEGLIYENWEVADFDIYKVLENNPNAKTSFGLDFGYSISYNAFICIAVDMAARKLWVFDEMYDRGMSNIDLAKKLTRMGYGKEMIFADCAEPKSIYELQAGLIEEEIDDDGNPVYTTWGLPGIRPAMKGNDSVMNGIQRLQSFRIIVHPSCQNTIVELSNYAYDQDKDGKYIDKPIKEFDHLMDSMRYASEKFFIRAHGAVAEAKGMDNMRPVGSRRSKRVVSA